MGRPCDVGLVQSLLATNGLPGEDVDGRIEHLFLAWNGKTLAATAGLELLGGDGLLRSVCVRPNYRGRRLAGSLCDRVEAYARNASIGRLYLLTMTAKEFFARRG